MEGGGYGYGLGWTEKEEVLHKIREGERERGGDAERKMECTHGRTPLAVTKIHTH